MAEAQVRFGIFRVEATPAVVVADDFVATAVKCPISSSDVRLAAHGLVTTRPRLGIAGRSPGEAGSALAEGNR